MRTVHFTSALLLSALVSCTAGYRTNPVMASSINAASGSATINGNDIAFAREAAMNNALKKLIALKTGQQADSGTIIPPASMLINQNLFTVKALKVIEQETRGKEYHVRVEGEVVQSEPYAETRKAVAGLHTPKFIIMIDEEIEGKPVAPGFTTTGTTISEIMLLTGFRLLEPDTVSGFYEKNGGKIGKILRGSDPHRQLQPLIANLGAGGVIYGKVKTIRLTLPPYLQSSINSRQAVVTIKAVDIQTGALLASATRNVPSLHIDPEIASRTAIQRCVRQLLGEVQSAEERFVPGMFMQQLMRSAAEKGEKTQ